MAKYRNKPVVIEAMLFNNKTNMHELMDFLEDVNEECKLQYTLTKSDEMEYSISTLEGEMKLNKGDYIIKGVNKEIYPCKSDVFEATYEKVE